MKSDEQVQEDVIEQLKWEPLLTATEIGVAVKNGIVTLSGNVDAYNKKLMAELAVKKVSGVKAVAMDIHVGKSVYGSSDTELAAMVFNLLRLHTALQEGKIRIKVEQAVVTLEGEVEWGYQRKAAITAVQHLPGVRNVLNYIVVKPKLVPQDIQQKINNALIRSATIDAEKITVETIGAKVILTGTVRSIAEREDAEDAAWSAPGVGNVENRLDVEETIYEFD